MIDIKKAREVYRDYIKDYDIKNCKIALKVAHIERTAKRALELAKALELNNEDIQLAELIGLLHDIGRFEQVRIYNTFHDSKSVNHGEYGVKVLFEDGLIRKFLTETKYDNIIRLAILNHNRDFDNIDKNLTEQELLHIKIIRDADKTDIFYTILADIPEAVYGTKDLSIEKVTEIIYCEARDKNKITYSNMNSPVDMVIAHMVFVYDINFKYTLEVIQKNDYIGKIYERVVLKDKDSQKKLEEIYIMVQKYMEEKI